MSGCARPASSACRASAYFTCSGSARRSTCSRMSAGQLLVLRRSPSASDATFDYAEELKLLEHLHREELCGPQGP